MFYPNAGGWVDVSFRFAMTAVANCCSPALHLKLFGEGENDILD